MYDYCRYVDRVKGNLKAGLPVREAVGEALEHAIKSSLLEGFFKSQKYEVLNMSLTEFDQEEYDRNRREEGREEGMEVERKKTARNLLAMGLLTYEQIAQATGLPVDDVARLKE